MNLTPNREALLQLKDLNDRAYLALIHWDKDIRLLLLAWTIYHPAPRKSWTEHVPMNWTVKRITRHCWRGVTVDSRKLSALSGIPARTIPELFERLKEARLIYPDGTANEEALMLIRAEMESEVWQAQQVSPAPITVPESKDPEVPVPPGALTVKPPVK